MTRERLPANPRLITALLKEAVKVFGPPRAWDHAEVVRWIRRQVNQSQPDAFDPKAAAAGEHSE